MKFTSFLLASSLILINISASPVRQLRIVNKAVSSKSTPSSTSSGSHETFQIDQKYIDLANDQIKEIKKDQQCYFSNEELFQHAISFANDYLYPNNVAQAKSINSSYFAEDVVGRIDVTRNFEGKELNTEYLFGLFSQLSDNAVTNLIGYSTSYDVYEFLGNCNQYTMSVVNNGTFPSLGNASLPIAVNIWIKLNEYKEIVQYDLTFLKFERLFEAIELAGYQALSGNKTATEIPEEGYKQLQGLLVKSICDVHDHYCQKDYPQYDSKQDCIDYLTKTRLGKDYEGGRNTVWCRSLHQNMIEYRPNVHCPHLGPSGGDMCTDEDTGFLEVTYNYKKTFHNPWMVINDN